MTDPRTEMAFREHWPFEITADTAGKPMYQMLATHLEYMATGGKAMPPHHVADLHDFYRRLRKDDLVVVFDGEDWSLEPRELGDLDLIIRPNRHTVLSDRNGGTRMLWRYPPTELQA